LRNYKKQLIESLRRSLFTKGIDVTIILFEQNLC
jgi:hypothetical protein